LNINSKDPASETKDIYYKAIEAELSLWRKIAPYLSLESKHEGNIALIELEMNLTTARLSTDKAKQQLKLFEDTHVRANGEV
jgi:hypothetical protein